MVRKEKSPDKPAKKAIKKSAASGKPAGSDGLGLFDSKADSLAKHTEDSSGEFLSPYRLIWRHPANYRLHLL